MYASILRIEVPKVLEHRILTISHKFPLVDLLKMKMIRIANIQSARDHSLLFNASQFTYKRYRLIMEKCRIFIN